MPQGSKSGSSLPSSCSRLREWSTNSRSNSSNQRRSNSNRSSSEQVGSPNSLVRLITDAAHRSMVARVTAVGEARSAAIRGQLPPLPPPPPPPPPSLTSRREDGDGVDANRRLPSTRTPLPFLAFRGSPLATTATTTATEQHQEFANSATATTTTTGSMSVFEAGARGGRRSIHNVLRQALAVTATDLLPRRRTRASMEHTDEEDHHHQHQDNDNNVPHQEEEPVRSPSLDNTSSSSDDASPAPELHAQPTPSRSVGSNRRASNPPSNKRARTDTTRQNGPPTQ